MVIDGQGEGQSARALGEEKMGDRSRIGARHGAIVCELVGSLAGGAAAIMSRTCCSNIFGLVLVGCWLFR